jgi:hypothetical protein
MRWNKRGNIRGIHGAPGPKGPKGDKGDAGPGPDLTKFFTKDQINDNKATASHTGGLKVRLSGTTLYMTNNGRGA